jgi:hypothetical protein
VVFVLTGISSITSLVSESELDELSILGFDIILAVYLWAAMVIAVNLGSIFLRYLTFISLTV